MPHIQVISSPSKINLNDEWVPVKEFKSKGRTVDKNGHEIDAGRQYWIFDKRERAFSFLERFGRGLLRTIAVVCTLGLALFSKSVRDLFTKSKESIRFAVRALPVNLSSNGVLVVDENLLDFSKYPTQVEVLKKVTQVLVGVINDEISKQASQEKVDIFTNGEPFSGWPIKLIEPGEDEVQTVNAFATDKEYYNATYLGYVVNKLVELGHIKEIVQWDNRGYVLKV